jgi:hypothetical protein
MYLTLVFPLAVRFGTHAGRVPGRDSSTFLHLSPDCAARPGQWDTQDTLRHFGAWTPERQRSITGREEAQTQYLNFGASASERTGSLGLIGLIPTREIGLDDGIRQVGRSRY